MSGTETQSEAGQPDASPQTVAFKGVYNTAGHLASVERGCGECSGYFNCDPPLAESVSDLAKGGARYGTNTAQCARFALCASRKAGRLRAASRRKKPRGRTQGRKVPYASALHWIQNNLLAPHRLLQLGMRSLSNTRAVRLPHTCEEFLILAVRQADGPPFRLGDAWLFRNDALGAAVVRVNFRLLVL